MHSRTLSVVLILLAMVPLLHAFTISDYLHDDEASASITYTNFTFNGSFYSMVAINGAQTFLIQDNELVTDPGTISSALHSYYLATYYPSQDDINGLLNSIQTFNNSRNDGYDFKGKEEYTCRNDILFANGKINVSGVPVRCVDNVSCIRNAQILFNIYGQGLHLASPDVIVQPLENFALSSFAMDAVLSNDTNLLNNLNADNLPDAISYLGSTATNLTIYTNKIEGTIFRTPRLNDSADRAACSLVCWAICPSFGLDHGALADIQSRITSLAAKTGPLATYPVLSSQISNNTAGRLDYLKTKSTAAYYGDIFGSASVRGSASIILGVSAISHVSDSSLSDKLDRLMFLNSSISREIANKNFTQIDADIAEYDDLTGSVANLSNADILVYDDALNAKKDLDATTLLLDSKELDAASLASFTSLKNQTAILDSRLNDGMDAGQLVFLRASYKNLTSQESELLAAESNSPASKAALLFRGFSRRVDTGLVHVASDLKLFQHQPSSTDAPLISGAFSLVLFLCLLSVLVLFFLRVAPAFNSRLINIVFISCLVLAIVFSVFMYTLMLKSVSNATLSEFLSDFGGSNSTNVFVDFRNVSAADSQLMNDCGGKLALSLASKNKTVAFYTVNTDSCSVQSGGYNSSLNLDDCAKVFNSQTASFVLTHSDINKPPKFSIIYLTRATISANSYYYQTCPLPTLFS